MVGRRTRTAVARLLLGALLFAQAAISAAACDMPGRAPAQAFGPQESMPCHQEPDRNANVCLAHCLNADQSADTPQVTVPGWSSGGILTIAVLDPWVGRAAILLRVLPQVAAPPPRILFQTFLI